MSNNIYELLSYKEDVGYICKYPNCNKVFGHKHRDTLICLMNRHKRTSHNDVALYKCEKCNKEFIKSGTLFTHNLMCGKR